MDAPHGQNEMHWEKARWELHKNAMCCYQQILEATFQKIGVLYYMATYLPSHKLWVKQKHTAGEVRKNLHGCVSVD